LDNSPLSKRNPETGSSRSETETPNIRRPSKIFYGWWIVGASTLASTIQSAFFNVGASAIFLPAAREFGTTRTVISGAFAFSRLEGGITGPLEGFLIHWVGPRRYMMVGWVIFGLGLISVGLAQSILQFYAAFLVVTLGQSIAGFLPIVTVLVNWFQRWRGRAIALFQLGGSVGAMLVPAVAWFILNFGWRETMIVSGIIVIPIGVPLAWIMRARPEDYGYLPDGDMPGSPAQDPMEDQESQAATGELASTIGQALRSRSFWFLGTAHAASLTAWGALRVNMIPALVDIGLDEQTAANILAMSLIIAGAGRLIGGFMGDMLGTRRVLVVTFLLQAIAVMILAFASTIAHALVFAVTFGLSFGARGTLMTMLRGDVFGRTNFSRLAGLMDPLSMVGVVISPVFAAFIYDTTGSYRIAFLAIAAVVAMGTFLVLGIRIPQRPEPPIGLHSSGTAH
jgi:sugar phosphate permease